MKQNEKLPTIKRTLYVFMVLVVLLLLIILPAILFFNLPKGARVYRFKEIESDVLEGGENTTVFITLLTPNASVDIYVMPAEEFSENPDLDSEFEVLEKYTYLNLTTNITYSFNFYEDEYPRYELIFDNSDNFRDNDTPPITNETLEIKIFMEFPETGEATIYKGIIASFLVFLFCGAVVARSVREKWIKKKKK